MNKQDFELRYANRSGVTIDRLHELGGHAEPCNCDWEKCIGWQMVFPERGESGLLARLARAAREGGRAGVRFAKAVNAARKQLVRFGKPMRSAGSARKAQGKRKRGLKNPFESKPW